MKDHEIAQLHNDLRDTADRYIHTQQLRARLVSVVAPLVDENRRLQEALDYDKRKLCSKITEILVITQFAFWVDAPTDKTAREVKDRKKRACEYYLQHTDQKDMNLLIESNRFHGLINNQAHFLMRLFEQTLGPMKKKTCEECEHCHGTGVIDGLVCPYCAGRG